MGLFVLLIASLVFSSDTVVEVRSSEVWLVRDGKAKQLTFDKKSKVQAILSPSADRVAYSEMCPESEHCVPEIVILDLEGRRVRHFQVRSTPPGPCISILSIEWVDSGAVAAECHVNPSVSEYVETELATGKAVRDLFGLQFTRSPDGKKVAHVGSFPHFAPPFAQSWYLQVDHTTIYPLPKGVKPVAQKGLANPPDVVRSKGLTWSGIHEFGPQLSWSPDSQRIALVDCTYSWTANKADFSSAADGTESESVCALVVVSMNGKVAFRRELDAGTADIGLSWGDSHRLLLRAGGKQTSIDLY